ncbi:MAG: hypothetical protein K2G86_04280 [Prevotella sp.]|nr:hypothetical protein [Prevotella sp.]MDE6355215.1 hypothetical protein [Prevotella sp.]
MEKNKPQQILSGNDMSPQIYETTMRESDNSVLAAYFIYNVCVGCSSFNPLLLNVQLSAIAGTLYLPQKWAKKEVLLDGIL